MIVGRHGRDIHELRIDVRDEPDVPRHHDLMRTPVVPDTVYLEYRREIGGGSAEWLLVNCSVAGHVRTTSGGVGDSRTRVWFRNRVGLGTEIPIKQWPEWLLRMVRDGQPQ